MRLLLFSLFVAASSSLYSQENKTSGLNLPVRQGTITHHVGQGISIRSTNDSCFASEDGTITSKFKLPGEEALMIKKMDGTYVTYLNLSSTSASRGDKIKKGTFIGLVKKENDNYNLKFVVTDRKGRSLSQEGYSSYLF